MTSHSERSSGYRGSRCRSLNDNDRHLAPAVLIDMPGHDGHLVIPRRRTRRWRRSGPLRWQKLVPPARFRDLAIGGLVIVAGVGVGFPLDRPWRGLAIALGMVTIALLVVAPLVRVSLLPSNVDRPEVIGWFINALLHRHQVRPRTTAQRVTVRLSSPRL
jgi:hypothetical protein